MKILQKAVQKLIEKLSPRDNHPIQLFTENHLPINENLVKRYTKSELAALYKRPTNTLMRWINKDTDLKEELSASGYNRYQKEFKKEQVRIIFKHLGEPDYPN